MIIRRNGKIKLYSKGADSVIFERLSPSSNDVKLKTIDQLNVSVSVSNSILNNRSIVIYFHMESVWCILSYCFVQAQYLGISVKYNQIS